MKTRKILFIDSYYDPKDRWPEHRRQLLTTELKLCHVEFTFLYFANDGNDIVKVTAVELQNKLEYFVEDFNIDTILIHHGLAFIVRYQVFFQALLKLKERHPQVTVHIEIPLITKGRVAQPPPGLSDDSSTSVNNFTPLFHGYAPKEWIDD